MSSDEYTARWVDVCAVEDLDPDDVVRFDHEERTFAVYRSADSRYFATDGQCTHAKVHLSKGFLSGDIIECAKHNGRFNITTGKALGAPAIVDLGCYRVRVHEGNVQLLVDAAA